SITDEKREIINQLAIAAFKELAVGFACAGLACVFCASSTGIAMAFCSVVAMVAVNTLFRASAKDEEKYLYKIERLNTPKAEKQKRVSRSLITLFNYASAMSFATVFASTAGIAIHEIGHALAAVLLFKNPSVSISVNPWKNGLTTWSSGPLSKVGKLCGLKEAKLMVAAAGAVLILAMSLGLFVASHVLKDRHPKVCQYLNMIVIMNLIIHIQYALSALGTHADPSHDFVALKAGGIHPFVSVAVLVGLPVFVKGTLLLVDHLKKHTPISRPMTVLKA
ncbi:MAG: hypothetical protein WCG10_06995, partial [Chlamydiota bacterium]